jgi:lipopolysaccharide biosynthesis glycosyltransferase
VIYVDCDTLVSGDLQALYELPMGEYALGGVIDPTGHESSKVPRDASDVYLNSGVLLMDLVKLRADDFFNKCRDIYGRYREQVTWCDQCIINKYAENNKLVLSEEWNTQIPTNIFSKPRWNALLEAKTASVLHFVGSVKPWMDWCNPCIATYWWSYANDAKVAEKLRVPFSAVEQMILLSQTLDLNEDHEQASQVKSSIIAHLLNKLKAR